MPVTKDTSLNSDFFHYVEALNDGGLHCRYDKETGLRAIIAIDSTKRGPALGGCRCLPYDTNLDALQDAVRLAKGMTYKAAITNLNFGGGKSVIMLPPEVQSREALFEAFGEFVNSLGGQYITAVDSGTSTEDLNVVARKTPYVSSVTSVEGFPTGDPSPFTALGVFHGLEAAVRFKLNKDSLEGIHVAIQGLGHVGHELARLLSRSGAKLTVCDKNETLAKQVAEEFSASVCSSEEVTSIACDVFSPCALGAVINDDTLPQLQCQVIAGAANNQLAEARHGSALHQKGILYTPDYALNAAGLVYATEQYLRTCEEQATRKIAGIADTIMTIFERSASLDKPCSEVADELAEERLHA